MEFVIQLIGLRVACRILSLKFFPAPSFQLKCECVRGWSEYVWYNVCRIYFLLESYQRKCGNYQTKGKRILFLPTFTNAPRRHTFKYAKYVGDTFCIYSFNNESPRFEFYEWVLLLNENSLGFLVEAILMGNKTIPKKVILFHSNACISLEIFRNWKL